MPMSLSLSRPPISIILLEPSLSPPTSKMWDPEYDACDPFQAKRDHIPSPSPSGSSDDGSSRISSSGSSSGCELLPRSILASRARRQREGSLIQQLATTLPLPSLSGSKGRPLDKASILRLTVSYLKTRRVLTQLGLLDSGSGSRTLATLQSSTSAITPKLHPDFDVQFEDLLGDGFLLVVTSDGDIVHISQDNSLGFPANELIGKSVYEWTHSGDHLDVRHLLQTSHKQKSPPGVFRRSALIRFKLSVFISQSSYKVFQVNGKLFQNQNNSSGYGYGNFFIGLVQPIPHPADNTLPFLLFSSEQIFVTFVSPDMKCMTDAFLRSVQANNQSLNRFLGFTSRERYGRLCYDYIHPEDALAVSKSVKTVYSKGQSVEHFRFLRRRGGFVQVFTQSTALDEHGRITTGNPTVIICRHHVIRVYDTNEIVAGIQMADAEQEAQKMSCSSGSPTALDLNYDSSSDRSRSSSSSTSLADADFDFPDYLDTFGPISPHQLEAELGDPSDLVPIDEMYTLDIYLQQHVASSSSCDGGEFGYGQLHSNTMMELCSW